MFQLKGQRELMTDVQMAAAAQELISNPVFKPFFESIEKSLFDRLMSIEVRESTRDERDGVMSELRAVRALYARIKAVLDEGKMSETKLRTLRDDRDKGRHNPRD